MGLPFSSKPDHSPLLQPAIEGDSVLIKTLVGRHIASYVNDESITTKYDPKLQEYVNMTDAEGNTPLLGAIFGGHVYVVKFLLDQCGADLFKKNKIGCSSIWVAAGYGHNDLLKYLISYCFDVLYENGEVVDAGDTRTCTDRTSAAKLLSVENNTGDSPFLAAVSRGHTEAARIIFEEMEKYVGKEACLKLLCSQNKAGDTPLSVVVGSGYDGPLLDFLLEKQTLIGIKSDNFNGPLYTTNSKGLSPLMIACERNYDKIVQVLIQHGAIFDKDSKGRNPLAIAAFCGCTEVVQYLLTLDIGKSQLNESDNHKCTPLWLAARTGNAKMVKLLVEAGADLTVKNVDDMTAQEVALKYKKDNVIEYFMKYADLNC